MSTKEKKATQSGIVVDAATGERHIPSSTRPDGSQRKEIRIRPGYRPPEDVEVYKNPSAAAWKNRPSSGVPGAEAVTDESRPNGSIASNKNAKRREARKKAKAAGAEEGNAAKDEKPTATADNTGDKTIAEASVDPEAEKEKKSRNLKKKLRQARELRDKKDKGEALLPEQLSKIIKINELIRELGALGIDSEDEEKPAVEG
jgi:partner of Y14 and mago protein